MSIVSSVIDGTRAILKRPRKGLSAKALLRLETEAVNIRRLNEVNANVPKMIEYALLPGDSPFILMEFIDGPTLSEFMNESEYAIEFPIAEMLFRSLLKTFELAHSQDPPILHRDVKPQNMIVRDDQLVLVDFGLSFSGDPKDDGATSDAEHIGNRWFQLPEYRTSGGIKRDHRSDLTAICGIFYFMLSGKCPSNLVDGTGLPPHRRDQMQLIGHGERTPMVNSFFDKAFRPILAERFQSWTEVLAAINGFDPDIETSLGDFARETAQAIANSSRAQDLRRQERLPTIIQVVHKEALPPVEGFSKEVKILSSGQISSKIRYPFSSPTHPHVVQVIIKSRDVPEVRSRIFFVSIEASETLLNVIRISKSILGASPRTPKEKLTILRWFDIEPDQSAVASSVRREIKHCLAEIRDAIVGG